MAGALGVLVLVCAVLQYSSVENEAGAIAKSGSDNLGAFDIDFTTLTLKASLTILARTLVFFDKDLMGYSGSIKSTT